ncbi:MerR family transcriptional regulator [Faecalibaculum rodentium]|uniref:MerR family transcriptional regulator n=1 Tax=Faecalibaculum rodentium TaxID=1702221 RepID=UPI002637E15D|nr:MerR family transcriptional regulator [Faecalibaculum rodentium]
MITIGKMSQACQLSVKTLRWYDQTGLLKPVHIDEKTGFRYYSLDQIDRVILIKRYKRFGFSLEEIASLLEAEEDSLTASLFQKRRELEAQILELQQISAEMGKFLKKETEKNKMSEEIRIVETSEMPVYGLRQHMAVKDFGTAFGTIFEQVAKDHLQPAGPTGARYYDEEFDREDSDIEVFIPLATKEGANASVGGMTCAKLTHNGGYSTLDESYARLVKWIEENGYQTTGAPYELYVKTGYENPNPATWETDIYFPVGKKQG